ncbi:Uncharacterised protein [Segatella copri]|nr:Uncharacterised protein [Segatella copri]
MHTPETYVCTVTRSNLTVEIVCNPVHIQYLVVRPTCVDTNTILEVLTNLILPCNRKLTTP